MKNNSNKIDIALITIVLFILGIIVMSQFFSTKSVKKILQPESSDVMALEIEKTAKTNANLKHQIDESTKDLNGYITASSDRSKAYDQYLKEIHFLDEVNGQIDEKGEGVIISIDQKLSTAQLVDLINALKNIGALVIEINGKRISINYFVDSNLINSPYTIKAIGNSTVLESALKRKGGIVEQIENKSTSINIAKNDSILIPKDLPINFVWSKIISN